MWKCRQIEILYHPLAPARFPKASTNDNVHQSPSPRGGGGASATQPKPGTTEYHKDKAKMICNVAVQHMQGWWGAI